MSSIFQRILKTGKNCKNPSLIPSLMSNKKKLLPKLSVRHLHQDYYHPYDVPIYQTPTLGSQPDTPEKVSPTDVIHPYSMYDIREENLELNYEPEGSDFKSYVLNQYPEIFLPEEPTFLEFWGYYPFLLFTLGYAFSHEYLMLLGSCSNTVIFAATGALTITILYQVFAEIHAARNQFLVDQEWVNLTTAKFALDGAMARFKENMKSKQRSLDFDNYIKELTRYKLRYFAINRKKKETERILDKLRSIKMAEERVEGEIMKEKEEAKEKTLEGIDDLESIRSPWKSEIEKLLNGQRKEFSAPEIKSKILKHISEKQKESFKRTDIKTPIDKNWASYYKAVDNALKDLEIGSFAREAGSEHIPDSTGILKKLSVEEIEKKVSGKKIRDGSLGYLQKQISRFAKGKAPQSLLELKKKFSVSS